MLAELPSVLHFASNEDPISGYLSHDWASVGGWSMFVALAILIVIGSFRETWVPGRRYRRLERAAEKISEANDKLTEQNGQLITANEITKHFFEETVPKRGHVLEDTIPNVRSRAYGFEDTSPRSRFAPSPESAKSRHALPVAPDEDEFNRGGYP